MKLRAVVLLACALPLPAACVSAPEGFTPAPVAAAPRFDPFTFFAGDSSGTGTLTKAFSDPVPVRVTSKGRIETEALREAGWAAPPRRVLVIDQTIREGEKPPRTRKWRLVEVAPGRYEGSLSDAISPVTGRAEGNQLVLEFTMKDGLSARQALTLAPDGASAANILTVRKLGATIAVLTEEIVRR